MNTVKLAIFATTAMLSTDAFALSCPGGSSTLVGHVSAMHFNTDENTPTFKLKEYPDGDPWMGINIHGNTEVVGFDDIYAMLTALITAKTGGYKVQVTCSGGLVDAIFVDYP